MAVCIISMHPPYYSTTGRKNNFPTPLISRVWLSSLAFCNFGNKHRQENSSGRAGNMIMQNGFIACNIFFPCLGYYHLTGDTGPEKHNELENAAGAQIGNFTPGFICMAQMDT